MDFRVAKILRFGGMRTQVGVDIYNLMNVDVVTAYNQTFVPGGPWLAPTALQPARYARLSLGVRLLNRDVTCGASLVRLALTNPGLQRGSANTYTALAPLAVSASGVTTVCVAAIGPPPDVMAMN